MRIDEDCFEKDHDLHLSLLENILLIIYNIDDKVIKYDDRYEEKK